MELTVKIDLVTLRLELLVDAVEVLDLKHEVRHIVDRALQVTDGLVEPLEDKHSALLGDIWDQLLNFILQEARCRSQILFDLLGVQVEQTNVRDTGQLRLEVVVLPLEQGQGVLKRLN